MPRRSDSPTPPATGRAYRGTSADQRREERHRRLIEAGIRVIGRDSYRATTVRAVCAEAGLTERYFYEAFGDREALLGAVYTHLVGALQERLSTRLMAADFGQPADLVRLGLTEFFSAMRADPDAARILLFEILGVSPQVMRLTQTAIDDFAGIIQALAVALDLRFDPREEKLVTAGLVGAMVFIAMSWTLSKFAAPLDDVVASGLAIFEPILRSRASGRPSS